ncbi:cell surface glycoprotein MUC18 isoform X2 [Polyodon spathula]|uniref:cell surface glycoprotein MUC18 isoform X2 n=1 Tax=Polyodon spathula TaxID=7913 RepID=UPI001B7E700E|nr:cell surface glycoprotein MUC18 isoform X2 [Polyodon spathula]
MALQKLAQLNSAPVLGILLILTIQGVSAEVTVSMKDVVEVQLGDTATIQCTPHFSEETKTVLVQWFIMGLDRRERIYYTDGTDSVADNGTEYTDRISVQEDYTLAISNVGLSDERAFICQVGGMSAGNGENRTELRVYDAPEFPAIDGTRSGLSVSSEEIQKVASCVSRNGYPEPKITWYKNRSPLQTEEEKTVVMSQVTKEASGLYTVSSSLLYRVSKEDVNSTFYCEVSYRMPGAEKMMESRAINVTVHYPTKQVLLIRDSPKGLVKEGDEVELRCIGDGNPPPPYTFHKLSPSSEEEEDLSVDTDVLILRGVTRADSGVYRCKSLDIETFEEQSSELKVLVNYLDPIVLTPSGSAELLLGETLAVSCNALSSQETRVVWMKDGQEMGQGSTLTLANASFDSAGDYICTVTVPAVPGLHRSSSVRVRVLGIPVVLKPVQLEVRDGSKVNLTCKATGFPEPSISWKVSGTKDYQEVAHHVDKNTAVSVMSVIVTPDLKITCNASNSLGSDEGLFGIALISVTPPPPSPSSTEGSGVIIVGIIVGILLLAILGSVLYFLYKTGKIPCGRSGKQEISRADSGKDDIVVEMKTDKTEEAGLLQGVNGDKKPPSDQCEKYIDLRN